MPRNAAYPFLDWPGPLAFAHRGGASEAPENTMPAFEHAVGLGYRYLETDVHLTADGVLAAFHDDRLDRVTDRQGLIAELPWAEVARARVDGREPIPRLEDLLGAFPEVRINIDPKHDRAVGTAGRGDPPHRQRRIGCAWGRSATPASPRSAPAWAARSAPRWARGRSRGSCPRRGAGPGAGGITSPCAQVPTHQGRVPLVTRRFVDTAHRFGVQVHVWTVDDAAEMARLLDLGVDGIMTDRPAVLKELLVERGGWA